MKPTLMRCCVAVVLLVFLVVSGATHAEEAKDWEGNANFLLGWKGLDEDDWGSLDGHDEFAAMISFGRTDWPVQDDTGVGLWIDGGVFEAAG